MNELKFKVSFVILFFFFMNLVFFVSQLNMVQKRPFDDEELYEISSKHPRQLDHNNHLLSFLEFVPFDDYLQKPRVPGEEELI